MTDSHDPPGRTTRMPWRPIVLALAAGGAVGAAYATGMGANLEAWRAWIESCGAAGPLAFVLIYAAATVAAVPGTALTLAAGALFGSLVGVVTVSAASTLGAGLSFLIARYAARRAVTRWLERNETFQRLDALTSRHGARIVALVRLVPLFPFSLVNYAFGLTRVPLTTYLFWSWLCMLPATVLYVVGADAVMAALVTGRAPWGLAAIAVAAVLLLVLLVRSARVRLGRVGDESKADP